MKKKSILMALFALISWQAGAQSPNEMPAKKDKKNYTSIGVEGSILQFALMLGNDKMIPRYTYFFNSGVDYNHRLNKSVSVFTGIHLKNIGLIRENTIPANPAIGIPAEIDVKTKERVYTLGAPVGLRVYSRDRKSSFKLGADVGLALNHKAKVFQNNEKLNKSNEWFSDKAALVHYSVFAGGNIRAVSLSVNYYLNNFYGSHRTGLSANLLTVGIGLNIDNDKLKGKKIDVKN